MAASNDVVAAARQALFAHPSRAIVVVDASLLIVAVNDAYATLLGHRESELVNRPLLEAAVMGTLVKQRVEAVAAGGGPELGMRIPYDWGDVIVDGLPLDIDGARYVLLEVTQETRDAIDAPNGVAATRRVFTDVSRRLASVSAPVANEAIAYALRAICEAYDIDRAYVRLLTDDERRFVLTHEHHRASLEPWRARQMSVAELGWAYERFRAGQPVVLTDLDDLPAEATTFRGALEAIGVSSTVGVPVLHGPRVLGYVAWVHHARRVWPRTIVDRLQLGAEMIASVVARCIAEDELRDRLAFEETLTAAAARFVDLEPERVDAEIARTLATFGESRGLDRAVVLTLGPSDRTLDVAHEWCAQGVPSVRTIFTSRPVDELAPAVRRALAGEAIAAREEDVRPGSEDAELLRRMGVHGFALVPLLVGGGVRGVLTLQVMKHSRHDGELAAPRARLVADVLADALSRKAATEQLRRSRHRFQRVLESAMDGIVALDGALVVTEWSAPMTAIFGRARDAVLRKPFVDCVDAADRAMVERRLAAVATSAAAPGARFELRAVHPDGRVVHVELSAMPLETSEGVTVAAFARDVTDKKRAEVERQRAFDEVTRLKSTAERERDYLREEQDRASVIVGESPAIRAALSLVDAVAETDATVLLTGESGVGKECFARLVHTSSRRAAGPFVRVNCASIPATLFESEFFGHAKGAFTGAHKDRLGRFELADGGTLLLDEVGEIPLDLQAKLLRVLQEGELERIGEERTRRLDVRVVAATNRDLAAESASGKFRGDLYFRLGVFPVRVPPLRERGDDILLLARHFVARHATTMQRGALPLTRDDEARLRAYEWPGNVRELDHVIERAVILSRAGVLRLDLALPGGAPTPSIRPPSSELLREDDLKRIERDNLLLALERANGRVSGPGGVAELLGMRPSTARDRMKALGIQR